MYFNWADLDEEETVDELIEGLGNLSYNNLLTYVAGIISEAGFTLTEVSKKIDFIDKTVDSSNLNEGD